MTVAQMIEWLKTQDQGATVEVVVADYCSFGGDADPRAVDFDPDEHADYADMRNNPFAKGQPYANTRTLLLGEL